MNKIEFKKHTFWPDIKNMDKMLKNGENNYEFIGFCFEISMIKENKTTNAYFAGYLFLDFFEEDRKISFDIPQVENDSNEFFLYRIENKKSQPIKAIYFENSKQKVKMKPEVTSITYDPSSSYNDLINQFIKKDMTNTFDDVTKFLSQHNISYEKDEVETYFKDCKNGAKNFFADKLLPQSIIDKYNEISSILLYEKMDTNLAQSPVKKAPKI
jgi:hypothetical protein